MYTQHSTAAPVRRTLRHISTPQGDIAYTDTGSGPAALFVHGIFLNGYLWRHVIDQVSDLRRCIAVDLLGHGGTTVAPGQDLSFHAQQEMLFSFCKALGLDKIDLVGNDSGGGIAQIFATQHGEQIRSLTLTNCDTHDNCPPQAAQPLIDVLASGGLTALGSAMLADVNVARTTLGPGYERPQDLSPETLATYLEPLFANPERARTFESLLRRCFLSPECHQAFVLKDLDTVRAPTLIVWGTDDVFFDVKWAHWLREKIPGTRELLLLDGARLFFPEERPRELAAALRRLWSETAR